ncbi:MAG TPA: recombinase family protein [Alphaproteobacteria bacterium]|nr:recombinase family protein [Alphaproteobacteria bacterium]
MTAPKRAAIYLRVSTNEQNTDNQREVLQAVAKRAGWDIVGVYEDKGISGAKGPNGRPQFKRLLEDATARKFDVIATVALDRIGRSMAHLVTFLGEIKALGVDLYIHDQHLDTSTPMGEMLFNIAGTFAQFERRLVQERVRAGIARARTHGTRSGKPIGRPKGPSARRRSKERKVLKLHGEGKSQRQIASETGLGKGTVQMIVSETPRTA